MGSMRRAPRAAWNLGFFRRKYGGPDGQVKPPVRGWDAVTVPGAVAAWGELHARFGKLPLADLLQPAIQLAERGYGVSHVVAYKWANAFPELRSYSGFAGSLMPNGRSPAVGELFRFPDAARTLRRLASAGPSR